MKRDVIEENHCKRYELRKHLEKHGNQHHEQKRFQRIKQNICSYASKIEGKGPGHTRTH